MDGLLATVSGIMIFVCALVILDAVARRRYKTLAFFTAATIVSGVICYISLSKLPDPHGYRWYWKAVFPVGIILFAVFGSFVVSTPKRKWKSMVEPLSVSISLSTIVRQ